MISLYNVMRIILRLKNLNNLLEIDILRNYCQKNLGVLRGDFRGTGCPKDAQTMISCSESHPMSRNFPHHINFPTS